MAGLLSRLKRGRTIDRWVGRIAQDELDPRDWQAIAVGDATKPPVVYIPIPKAANTSIRTALLPCFGLAEDEVRNVHQDSRVDKRSQKQALADAAQDAIVFTVVRHPALRILSAYRNKIGRLKPRFGHAARLGISKGASFDEFLSILASVPVWQLDSHFKPQWALLHYASQDPRLETYRSEEINDLWPAIATRISERVEPAPKSDLGILNRTDTPKDNFTPAQKRLIEWLYAEDFEKFGYDWSDLAE